MAEKTNMDDHSLINFEDISYINSEIGYRIPTFDGVEYGYDVNIFFLDGEYRYNLFINSVTYFSYCDHYMKMKTLNEISEDIRIFASISKKSKLIDWIRSESMETSDYFNINHIRLIFIDLVVDLLVLGDVNIKISKL